MHHGDYGGPSKRTELKRSCYGTCASVHFGEVIWGQSEEAGIHSGLNAARKQGQSSEGV